MGYTLEQQRQFIFEEQTELCKWHCEGAPEKKIVYGAKSAFQSQALLGLERHGV